MAAPDHRRRIRVTDRERERAVAFLQRSCAQGAIGMDTFEARVALAYGAQTVHELDRATGDLPSWWRRLALKVEHVVARLEELFEGNGNVDLPRLSPPPGRDSFVVGRDRRCTVVFDEPTVSREHAIVSFDHASGAWRLADLGSTNGTRINGRRVEWWELRPGDRIAFGQLYMEWEPPFTGLPR